MFHIASMSIIPVNPLASMSTIILDYNTISLSVALKYARITFQEISNQIYKTLGSLNLYSNAYLLSWQHI